VIVDIKPGKYVVAVSGGVDSVVLLDLLSKQKELGLVVAHFDHGIRPDSSEDRKFVATLSQKYNLPFEFEEGHLGSSVSEEDARNKRYAFLQKIRKKYNALAIVTAHHHDDAIETAVFNILRGTNRKGVVSLSSSQTICRPLLDKTKLDIVDYAEKNNLVWREDSTNDTDAYTRNWIRHNVIPKLSNAQRQQLTKTHSEIKRLNTELDAAVKNQLSAIQLQPNSVDRKQLSALPYSVAAEVVAEWLRENNYSDFDKKTIHKLVVGAKTLRSGKQIAISKNLSLEIHDQKLLLKKFSSIQN
jgi:tRNA(Ile)-lysidine synthase